MTDVLTSAFDSAGQRCSALRVLCLQDDVADRVLGMLKGSLVELKVGTPDRLKPMWARLSRRRHGTAFSTTSRPCGQRGGPFISARFRWIPCMDVRIAHNH